MTAWISLYGDIKLCLFLRFMIARDEYMSEEIYPPERDILRLYLNEIMDGIIPSNFVLSLFYDYRKRAYVWEDFISLNETCFPWLLEWEYGRCYPRWMLKWAYVWVDIIPPEWDYPAKFCLYSMIIGNERMSEKILSSLNETFFPWLLEWEYGWNCFTKF